MYISFVGRFVNLLFLCYLYFFFVLFFVRGVYQWINNNKEILLTFDNGDETETLEYGIYNIENEKIKETKSLNPRE